MAIYKNTPPIVTNGLVLHLDAANRMSYPGSGTTWFDISNNNRSGSLINGPTFTNEVGGAFTFDGVNDYLDTTLTDSNNGSYSYGGFIKTVDGGFNAAYCRGIVTGKQIGRAHV